MKKFTAILLCLLMVLAFAGCGEQQESNEITALMDEGYIPVSTSYEEDSWAGVFQKDGSWDSVYLVTAAMTEKQNEAYFNVDISDENYEAEQAKILGQLTDVTVTDITDKVPSQEELDSYKGMTMGELEAAGFEKSGYTGDPGMGYKFYYDGPAYSLYVSPVDSESIEDLDNYSENDLRALKIEAVEFMGFSYGILEQ